MSDLYLAHHGILGMKWGIRRYQNPDGSLTEEGKRRLQKYNNRNALEGARRKYYEGKTSDVNKAAGAARSITSQARRNMTERQRREDDAEKQKIRDSIDLSTMSDEELRSAINRLQMEKQYKDLSMADVKASPEVQQGRDRVGRLLDNLDTALSVGASAVALAGAIMALTGADFDDDRQSKKGDDEKKDNSNSQNSKPQTEAQRDPTSSWAYKAGRAVRSGIDSYNTSREKAQQSRDIDRLVKKAMDTNRAGYEPAIKTESVGKGKIYGMDPLAREDRSERETLGSYNGRILKGAAKVFSESVGGGKVYGQDPLSGGSGGGTYTPTKDGKYIYRKGSGSSSDDTVRDRLYAGTYNGRVIYKKAKRR